MELPNTVHIPLQKKDYKLVTQSFLPLGYFRKRQTTRLAGSAHL